MPAIPSDRRARDTRWLRTNEKIGGYLPLLAMRPDAADAWAELSVAARLLDERSERHPGPTASPPPGLSVLRLRPELAPTLREGLRWSEVEARIYHDGRPRSVADYFELMYYRAYCPVYTCAVLAMPEEDRRWLEAFAMYAGCGAQLVDDTLDLVDDIDRGLLLVTAEELRCLSMSVPDLGTASGLRRVTRLRNQWALAYYLKAYRVTNAFGLENRRLARCWLDFGLRALLDGRVRPLLPEILADHRRYLGHFGALTGLFDLPFPSEDCRTAVARPFVGRVVARYAIVTWPEARAFHDAFPAPLPRELLVERVHDRPQADPAELPEHVPDGRRPIALVHYGPGGLLPTAVDVMRILTGL